jgi:anthranilate phosphoribosyltransferase
MQFVADIRRLLQRQPLDEDVMTRLWGAILDEALDDLEVGAVVAVLAAAGETREELVGLYRAALERMDHWSPALASRAVTIPAYGLVPGEAAMASLAAMLLRRFGVPVIVHGILDSPCGISSARVLRELGVLPCGSLAQAGESLRQDGIAFVPVQLLSQRFAALVALRGKLGIENSAHLVAQALDPTRSSAARLSFSVGGTRSERFALLAGETGGDYVALSWPAGRSPSSLATRPRIESVRDGARELLFEADAQEMRTTIPQPPDDAPGIARWITRVASGATAVPVPAVNLVAACLYAVGRAPDFAQAKAIAAVEHNPLNRKGFLRRVGTEC